MSFVDQYYAAQAYFPEWGNEIVSGQLMITRLGLQFQSDAGSISIPTNRLVAEVRAGNEDRITFTDIAKAGLEIYAEDLTLLEHPNIPALIAARKRLADRLSQGELKRRVRILAYCVLACVLITVLASFSMSLMVRSIAARVPASWDAQYGAAVLKDYGADEEFLADTNLVARVRTLAEPLLRVLPPNTNGYQFHIVADEDPNAFALPGGHIIINTGMLRMVEEPEELLGVIAHEMAHVTERHIYREQISTAGPFMICELFLGGQSGTMQLLGGVSALLVGAGFSQEYETEADNVGWDYLVKANVDPRGMIGVFNKLKLLENSGPGGGGVDVPQAFSSHPEMDKRIKRLEKRWNKLPRKAGFVALEPLPKLKQ